MRAYKIIHAYREESWSDKARYVCDNQIKLVKAGKKTVEEAQYFFHMSYKHPLIRQRAAKRFGKKLKAGKVI